MPTVHIANYPYHGTVSFQMIERVAPIANVSAIKEHVVPPPEECPHCSALRYPGEHSKCCSNGLYILPPLSTNDAITSLLMDDTEEAKNFRKSIRAYNNDLSLVFSKYEHPDLKNGPGLTPFILKGAAYFKQKTLTATNCANVLVYDPVAELRPSNTSIQLGLLQRLKNILQACNPLVKLYQFALQYLSDESHANDTVLLQKNFNLVVENGTDQRRYNLPTGSEIGVLVQFPAGEEYSTPGEIALKLRNAENESTSWKIIPVTHPAYLPLKYVLLFPEGDIGWHDNITYGENGHVEMNNIKMNRNVYPPESIGIEQFDEPQNPVNTTIETEIFLEPQQQQQPNRHGRQDNHVTQQMYYRQLLFPRANGVNNNLLLADKLFQEFFTTGFALIDQLRLDYYRFHQDEIRSDSYQAVQDALLSDADMSTVGRRLVLPASMTNGPRYLQREYQDAMAVCRDLGHPTLFITFTANKNWPEITAELNRLSASANTRIQDPDLRADIVSRIFEVKKQELLKDITKNKIFGNCIGYSWTKEYQKRGLPHIHLLVYLDAASKEKYLHPENIDQIVCAEIPNRDDYYDQESYEMVYKVVTSSMIHGPCGPSSPCCANSTHSCSKRFPKPYQEETISNGDSYPTYRRRENSPKYRKLNKAKTHYIDIGAEWVVPYSPGLCKNSMLILTSRTDAATVCVTDQNDQVDEIANYLDCRYIGPHEAVSRILSFRNHVTYPAVNHLAVHLEDQQYVSFNSTEVNHTSLDNLKLSSLQAWFNYNKENTDGLSYTYEQFPKHFTFISNKYVQKWQPRQKGGAIGRMPFVNRRDSDRFYLRLLLCHVPGATSYQDLRTFQGTIHDTFLACAKARGLVDDDKERIYCFNHASSFASGNQLRALFVEALTESVVDPLALWNRFKDEICSDLPYRIEQMNPSFPHTDDYPLKYDLGLYLISEDLYYNISRSVSYFSLPEPHFPWSTYLSNTPQDPNRLIAQELAYNPQQQSATAEQNRAQFNSDQAHVFNEIISAIENQNMAFNPSKSKCLFFVQGPAGTGKTFLWKTLCAYMRGKGKIVLCVASTGIASLLLPGGRTAHSTFRIPITGDVLQCSFTPNSDIGRLIARTDLIIWDEVPMQNRLCFEAVHRSICDLLKSDPDTGPPFAGIPVVMGGDWAQTLPVVEHGNRPIIVQASLRKSFLWNHVKCLFLKTNMRLAPTPESQSFADWLADLSYNSSLRGPISLPEYIPSTNDKSAFLEKIYPSQLLKSLQTSFPSTASHFASRAILTIRNDRVALLNSSILNMIDGPSETFCSADIATDDNGRECAMTSEFLASLNSKSIPLAKLKLKKGVPIMLIRNLNPKVGLCNGTRLSVISLSTYLIQAKILTGDFAGTIQVIPRIRITTDDFGFHMTRKQFPIRLAFAMTINKSQGQSLETVGLDLRTPPFSHGQLYVGLSRVTNVSKLTVLYDNDQSTTVNVVYPEALLVEEDVPPSV